MNPAPHYVFRFLRCICTHSPRHTSLPYKYIIHAISLTEPLKIIAEMCWMRVFHPECLAKQDYKKSEGSILTLCDIHYLVFVSQLAGCQPIYPPMPHLCWGGNGTNSLKSFLLIPQQWNLLFLSRAEMEKILGSGAEPQFWAQVSLEIWFNGPVKAFD